MLYAKEYYDEILGPYILSKLIGAGDNMDGKTIKELIDGYTSTNIYRQMQLVLRPVHEAQSKPHGTD